MCQHNITPLTHNWIEIYWAGFSFTHYKIAPLRWNWIVINLAGFSFRHCKFHHFLGSPGIKTTLRGKNPKNPITKIGIGFRTLLDSCFLTLAGETVMKCLKSDVDTDFTKPTV